MKLKTIGIFTLITLAIVIAMASVQGYAMFASQKDASQDTGKILGMDKKTFYIVLGAAVLFFLFFRNKKKTSE